jgi:hypothetical protein
MPSQYIRDTLLAQLNLLFAPISGIVARIDEDDPHTVNVFYPAAFEAGYIRPAVRLEIGPLASWVPSNSHSIKAYAAQAFSEPIENAIIALRAKHPSWVARKRRNRNRAAPRSVSCFILASNSAL